jgi:hypothetical protein
MGEHTTSIVRLPSRRPLERTNIMKLAQRPHRLRHDVEDGVVCGFRALLNELNEAPRRTLQCYAHCLSGVEMSAMLRSNFKCNAFYAGLQSEPHTGTCFACPEYVSSNSIFDARRKRTCCQKHDDRKWGGRMMPSHLTDESELTR